MKKRYIIAFCIGISLLSVGVGFDWADLPPKLGLPSRELSNPWIIEDLRILREACVVFATVLILSTIVLWNAPSAIVSSANKLEQFLTTFSRQRFFVPLCLVILVLAKTILQLRLYSLGYAAYSADDFSRSLSADYWLYHRNLDLGWNGWLGLSGSGWLPFADYLFGLGLALHRDIYLTPKLVNLVISGVAVLAVYFLGRELFGRAAGIVAAGLFAFQPWHIWLGISGMTSDLPSVVLITFFSAFLVRWLRTDAPGALLTAAVLLVFANGFRYENWFFSAVFSLLVVLIAAMRWNRGHLARRSVTMALCALATVNILPVVWMIASYVVLGDWLPALHVTNAWMVSFADAPKAIADAGFDLPTNQSPYMPQINMLVLALGSFPLEIGLSLCGLILFLKSNWSRPVCTYLLMVVSVLLLFGAVFKWRLPASLVFARYFVPFVALLIPFAGYLLFRLFSTSGFHQRYAIIALVLIVLVTVSVDLGRAFNYPDVFPKDAIAAGWMLRRLQENGVIPETSKILIERTKDFGDLGIVALANRPERFVAINQSVYEQSAVDSLTAGRPNRSSAIISARDGVRGRACDAGFNMEPCKNSFVREEFNLVILSTPRRIVSFEETFARRAWVIGRYHIFDMSSLRVQMRTKILA